MGEGVSDPVVEAAMERLNRAVDGLTLEVAGPSRPNGHAAPPTPPRRFGARAAAPSKEAAHRIGSPPRGARADNGGVRFAPRAELAGSTLDTDRPGTGGGGGGQPARRTEPTVSAPEAPAVGLPTEVGALSEAVRRIANDAEVSRSALDALTRTVEHQRDRVTEARRAIEGLAAIVDRQRVAAAADRDALGLLRGDVTAQEAGLQTATAAIERLQSSGRHRDDELARCQNAVRVLGNELQRSVSEQATGGAALEAALAHLEAGRRDQRVAVEQTAREVDQLSERLEAELAALRADQLDVIATLRDELAQSVAQVDELTGLSKRQAALITRLRRDVKALQEPKPSARTARTTKRATSLAAEATATPKRT
jgi:HAMP domain-containing protein